MVTLNVDKSSLNRTLGNVEKAIDESVDDATEDMLEDSIDEGRDEIEHRDAIWKGEVKDGFQKPIHLGGGHWILVNHSRHAGIVDKGADFDDHPKASSLVPWVLSELADWHPLDDDDGDGAGTSIDDSDDGGGGNQWDDNPYIGDSGGSDTGGGGMWGGESTSDGTGVSEGSGSSGSSYRASTFQTSTNGEVGFPTLSTTEILDGKTLSDTKTVNPQRFSTYEVLSDTEQDDLFGSISDQYGVAGHQVHDLLNAWKFDAWSDDAHTYEKIIKQRYDVDSRVRASDEYTQLYEITQDHRDAFHAVSIASQEFLKENYDDDNDGKLTAYRSFPEEDVVQLAEQMFNDPDKSGDRWEFTSTVVDNYSLSKEVSDTFSDGIDVQTTVDIEHDIVAAPDFLQPRDEKNEQEIHVIGGTRQFHIGEIEFVDTPAADVFMQDPRFFSDSELEDVKVLINKLSSGGAEVTNDEAISWLNNVADKWERERNTTALHDTIDTIIYETEDSPDEQPEGWETVSGSEWLNLEEGDVVETDYGISKVQEVNAEWGVFLGWNDYRNLVRPETSDNYYSLAEWRADRGSFDDLIHIGTTGGQSVTPDDSDPVVGIEYVVDDNGVETIELVSESEVPTDYDTSFSVSDTIGDLDWIEQYIGEVFYVRLEDGTVITATLQEAPGTDGFKFYNRRTDIPHDWWPSGADNAQHSEVEIVGVPD
jgi:hypothetical protein